MRSCRKDPIAGEYSIGERRAYIVTAPGSAGRELQIDRTG
jgi:hypothetical protein